MVAEADHQMVAEAVEVRRMEAEALARLMAAAEALARLMAAAGEAVLQTRTETDRKES